MTTPTGSITLDDVNIELGIASGTAIDMNRADVRGLAGVESGPVTLDDLRGKSNRFLLTISASQTDLNLRTYALANGWDGDIGIDITIASGVVIGGSTAGDSTAALTVDGVWPNGVKLINNGTIAGKGGSGGATSGNAGQKGGRALAASVAVDVDNQGIIGGGGGGAGAGAFYAATYYVQTTENNFGNRSATGTGGAGGVGAGPVASATSGLSGVTVTNTDKANYSVSATGCYGGNGGALGSTGQSGTVTGYSSSGTGNFVSALFGSTGAGGAGGDAVYGNSNVTWVNTGTIYGSQV